MLQRMFEVMRFRNTYPVFDGEFSVEEGTEPGQITMSWQNGKLAASLKADFRDYSYEISYLDPEDGTKKLL